MTADALRDAALSPDVAYSAVADSGSAGRGMIVVTHGRWEENVLRRPFTKVAFFGADSYEIAHSLALGALKQAAQDGVVLLSFRAGHTPTYVHVAAIDAGFHVGSQSLIVRADLQAIAPAVARIPVRGQFRA